MIDANSHNPITKKEITFNGSAFIKTKKKEIILPAIGQIEEQKKPTTGVSKKTFSAKVVSESTILPILFQPINKTQTIRKWNFPNVFKILKEKINSCLYLENAAEEKAQIKEIEADRTFKADKVVIESTKLPPLIKPKTQDEFQYFIIQTDIKFKADLNKSFADLNKILTRTVVETKLPPLTDDMRTAFEAYEAYANTLLTESERIVSASTKLPA